MVQTMCLTHCGRCWEPWTDIYIRLHYIHTRTMTLFYHFIQRGRGHAIYAMIKQKPYNFPTNTLKAYFAPSLPLSVFIISTESKPSSSSTLQLLSVAQDAIFKLCAHVYLLSHQWAIHNTIDKYVGKALLTTISCMVRFVAFCFTIKLHVQALPAYRPSHPNSHALTAYTKNLLQAFKSQNEGLGHRSKTD